MKKVPIWTAEACLRCGMCVGACPSGSLRLGNSGITIDGGSCISCMRCLRSCPTGSYREG